MRGPASSARSKVWFAPSRSPDWNLATPRLLRTSDWFGWRSTRLWKVDSAPFQSWFCRLLQPARKL